MHRGHIYFMIDFVSIVLIMSTFFLCPSYCPPQNFTTRLRKCNDFRNSLRSLSPAIVESLSARAIRSNSYLFFSYRELWFGHSFLKKDIVYLSMIKNYDFPKFEQTAGALRAPSQPPKRLPHQQKVIVFLGHRKKTMIFPKSINYKFTVFFCGKKDMY